MTGDFRLASIDSYGVSGDANIWLSSGFRVTGELFHGRALGIFSGNIAQSAILVGAARAALTRQAVGPNCMAKRRRVIKGR